MKKYSTFSTFTWKFTEVQVSETVIVEEVQSLVSQPGSNPPIGRFGDFQVKKETYLYDD